MDRFYGLDFGPCDSMYCLQNGAFCDENRRGFGFLALKPAQLGRVRALPPANLIRALLG
jgi:hypothetical protein